MPLVPTRISDWVAGSYTLARSAASTGGALYSYRTPAELVKSGRTRQVSWRKAYSLCVRRCSALSTCATVVTEGQQKRPATETCARRGVARSRRRRAKSQRPGVRRKKRHGATPDKRRQDD